MVLNAYWEPLEFELPPVSDGGTWRRWIDTALETPHESSLGQTRDRAPLWCIDSALTQ